MQLILSNKIRSMMYAYTSIVNIQLLQIMRRQDRLLRIRLHGNKEMYQHCTKLEDHVAGPSIPC